VGFREPTDMPRREKLGAATICSKVDSTPFLLSTPARPQDYQAGCGEVAGTGQGQASCVVRKAVTLHY
jgi:hypothetical protein